MCTCFYLKKVERVKNYTYKNCFYITSVKTKITKKKKMVSIVENNNVNFVEI